MSFSRLNPSPRYSEMVAMCRSLHLEGDKHHEIAAEETFDGRSLMPHVQTLAGLIEKNRIKTYLDYGSGKGKAYELARMRRPDGSEIQGLKAIWGLDDITLFDPCYPPNSAMPAGRFDAVVSTDVLEHCPAEDIPWIIDEIFGFARKVVFLTIACYPAAKSLPSGENAHITQESPGWWLDHLNRAADKHKDTRYYGVIYLTPQRTIVVQG